MAATTYTGTGTISQAVSNAVNTVSFQPDLVWVKARNASAANSLYDSIRGTKKFLASNTTDAEIDFSPYGVTAFGSSGFTVGDISSGFYYCNGASGGAQSGTPPNYVGWQWKAGGTAVSNTAGTITSTVSANTTAGFSVVTYTGTGANATVGHGLGVAPAMIIVKSRSASATDWRVFASVLNDNSKWLALNTTEAATTESGYWNTGVTSSVFGLGAYSYINGSGSTYVAYCWAPVAGYSAFGSYTGNGSADGPFIYTGFRPRWIMFKRTDTAGYNWHILDTSRSVSNAETLELYANLSDAETAYYSVLDGVSNGIKVRNADASVNASSGTYIYAAFAENPLKYANAR
jgi:hypothetical protein